MSESDTIFSMSSRNRADWKKVFLRALLYTSAVFSIYTVIYLITSHIHELTHERGSTASLNATVTDYKIALQGRIRLASGPPPTTPQMISWFKEISKAVNQPPSKQIYLIDQVGRIRAQSTIPNSAKLLEKLPNFWLSLSGEHSGTIITEKGSVVFKTLSNRTSQSATWYLVGFSPVMDLLPHTTIDTILQGGLIILLATVTFIFSLLAARYQLAKKALFEKLAESESMYKVFTENTRDWDEWLAPDGGYKYISPSCSRVCGYTKSDLAGNPGLRLSMVHPDDQAGYKTHLSRHTSETIDNNSDTLEFRIRTKDGQMRWIHHNCHPIISDRGTELGRYIVNRDITEEKLYRERIEKSVELSYATLESSADHIAVLDSQGYIQMVNRAWQNFAFDNEARCEKDDWIGVNYLSICSNATPPSNEGSQDVYQGLKAVIDGKKDHFEYEYPCHSVSDERWFLLRAVPLQYQGGGILVSHTNITEMKLAERELHLAASSFQASNAIVITDAETQIIRVNEAFSHITGYSETEVLGKTPKILQSGHHNQAFYQAMWNALNRHGDWEGEIWNRKKTGEIYPEHLKIKVIKNDLDEAVNYIAAFSDISRQKAAEEQINKLAFYDPLTELPNKNLFMERLQQTLSRSKRDRKYSAVLILDLNNFKLVNDSLGHQAGDDILIEVSKRICQELRQFDSAARITGDEFGLLITEITDDINQASNLVSTLAERILNIISKPYLIDGKSINLSACIGIDLFPVNNESADEVFKRADTAIHRAKESPGLEVVFYQEEMHAEINRRLRLQTELREAVKQKHFLLYYQDKVDTNESVIGSEALIRWEHPRQGILLPAHFIDVAESSDMIIDIGHWVLKTACRRIKHLQTSDQPAFAQQIAVNISANQFRQDNFIENIESVISEASIDASWLELEITESIAMFDIDDAVQKMNALKAYGIRWSIDDFGTGFSSLSYLKDLPFDTLKIDRSFVSNSHVNKKNQAIIKAIISMAHNLQLKVIAEGVERKEEAAFLKSIGCDYYQGYLYSKPRPLSIDL